MAMLTGESACPTMVRKGLRHCGAALSACQPIFSRLLTNAAPIGPCRAAQVEIATWGGGGDLAIGDGASEHPEAAIGMDPTDASGAEDTFGALDGPRDLLGRFDAIDLHIDHADAELDLRVDIFERLQILGRT